jgi:choline dehydrogenase-like flavoprotein
MALALECEELGLSVLLLESGGEKPGVSLSDFSSASFVNEAQHAPIDLTSARALGGTSWFWGGRCVPYDEIDFEPRSYVPESGWPIKASEVEHLYPAAASYLGCGSSEFFRPAPIVLHGTDVSASRIERWARKTTLAGVHGPALEASKVDVRLQHSVFEIVIDQHRRTVDHFKARSNGAVRNVKAKAYVLSAGGVGTTRLLLAAQARHPSLFGGESGPLGKFYMGHLQGQIADIVLNDSNAVHGFDFAVDANSYVRRRFTITPESQRKHRLLNIAFWVDNPRFYRASHRSGILSLVFLVLSVRRVGERIVSEFVRRMHVGDPPYDYVGHIRNVLTSPLTTVADLYQIIQARYIASLRRPGFLITNREGRYALTFHSEQSPRAKSRIYMGSEIDPLGLRKVCIDFEYDDEDARSVLRAHHILDRALRRSNVGHLEFRAAESDLLSEVVQQAKDGCHQIGTTRMGSDPRCSVVDSNCRTHDLANLFVASSSVFPTSSQANPTFLATALAIRLARHLKDLDSKRDYHEKD